ncbi:MAG: discoidin domain-containing protein, partial [Candidatus Symbiothrix sp.]|nr:discoidin domain-containing protein [Candidatus Symbiothrix sp.]
DNDLKNIVAEHDANDRRYQSNSRQGGGLTGSGFWTNFPARDYFGDGIPSWGGDFGDGNKKWGLRSELGMGTFTTFESFREFMPEADWWPADYTQNAMWDKHFFGQSSSNADVNRYFNTVTKNYGASSSIEAFCEKAQYLNLEIGKAVYEGWNDHLWDDATGILLWMSNPAYPAFVWQTYDYYNDATGVYWGEKKACEPIHIQWNCANNSVKIINNTLQDYSNLKAKATVYHLDGSVYSPLCREADVNVLSKQVYECFRLSGNNDNLALNKTAYSSGNDDDSRDSSKAVDGNTTTRWASNYDDNAWMYIDLGEPKEIARVNLSWEGAYGKQYIIQVSDNADEWRDVYTQNDGKGKQESLSFDPVTARYIKLQGVKRATSWGYSLWEFQVFAAPETNNEELLSDLNFIRLELRDHTDQLLSDNFYWRNTTDADDYTLLNSLPEVNLTTSTLSNRENGQYIIHYTVTNPFSTVAFGIRLRVVNARTGKRILPVFLSDNYFTLMPGESKLVSLTFDEALIGNDEAAVLLKQYGFAEEENPGDNAVHTSEVSSILQIYPNPTSEIVYIDVNDKEFSIHIFDLNGRMVCERQNEKRISVAHLPQGFYLLQAKFGNKTMTTKLIKQ